MLHLLIFDKIFICNFSSCKFILTLVQTLKENVDDFSCPATL